MTTSQILSPSFQMPKDYNQLVQIYRTLAKTADKRLVNIEAYSHDKGYRNIKKWAYARAQSDIQYWNAQAGSKEGKRFNTKPPSNYNSLRGKINDIITFLEAPTSTKKGINQMFKSRADAINQKYGTNFTWEDLGNFFESQEWEEMSNKYGSGTALEIVGVLQHNEDDLVKKLNGKKNVVIRTEDDDILNDQIEDAISEYGDDLRDLLFN